MTTEYTPEYTPDYTVAETHTATLSARERSEFWREHVRLNQGSLDFDFGRPEEFDGSTIVQRYGEHQVIEFWSDPIAYVRRPAHARSDDDRSLRLIVPRAGSVTVERPGQPGEVVVVETGWAALVSMTAPFTVRHDESTRAWILNVPEREWFHRLPGDRTAVLDLRYGVGSVTRSMVQSLSEQRDRLAAHEFDGLSARLSDLLNLCVVEGPGGRLQGIERSARTLVRERSDDPALTPADLADRLGWSLRQLQAALAAAGTTPSALIRHQRLVRAHTRLRSPSLADRSIGQIAHASGFGSLSGFNAAFRDEFGCSPREARRRGTSDGSPVAGDDPGRPTRFDPLDTMGP